MGKKAVSGNSGKSGRIKFGATELCVTEWNATEMAEEEETTSSCSEGKNEYEYGNAHIEGSMTADWDIENDPINSAPNIRAGAELADARLYVHTDANFNDTPYCHLVKCKVNNVRITAPAKGKVTYTFDFKSSGNYTFLGNADYS